MHLCFAAVLFLLPLGPTFDLVKMAPLSPSAIYAFEASPEVLGLLVADAISPEGKIRHSTKDAVNELLIARLGFPATLSKKKEFKEIWWSLERCIGPQGLCSHGMISLTRLSLTNQQLRELL